MDRRITAILAADVAGYSRLMGEDQAATIDDLRQLRRDIFEPVVASNAGTIVKRLGDGWIVEFPSITDAVTCALTIQESLAGHERIKLRIGIHIGEVAFEDEDVFGDGVNVASRLEVLAAPGEVLVSDIAYHSLDGQAAKQFGGGEVLELKNIARPVSVWRWSQTPVPHTTTGDPQPSRTRAEKPSIAVLPFTNLSHEPEQEFFADGVTEDIITGLSRFRSLFVIARNSTFAYKGQSPDVRGVARNLGVRYVLEGSVRRGSDRIRITAQLIEAETGNHIWAERYDRNLADLFEIQDQVTESIVASIAPEIGEVERRRAQRKKPENLDAWDIYQRGLSDYYSSTQEGFESAIEQFDKVNTIDPAFAPALAMAAAVRWRYVLHFQPEDGAELLEEAYDKVYKAIALDPRDATSFLHAGEVHSMLGEHDSAVLKVQEAIALNPADAVAHYFLGGILRRAGRPAEAIPHFDHAMRLSPHDIFMTGMLTDRAFVLFDLERYEEAYDWAQRARLSPNPRTMTFAVFAATLSKLGRLDEACLAVQDLINHAPGITWTKYRENLFGPAPVMERLADALRVAGLPK